MKMTEEQFYLIKAQLKNLTGKECFYKDKFKEVDIDSINTPEDFAKLPFTWKGDLREAYPLGLQAVPEEEIVRIHSSSGTWTCRLEPTPVDFNLPWTIFPRYISLSRILFTLLTVQFCWG